VQEEGMSGSFLKGDLVPTQPAPRNKQLQATEPAFRLLHFFKLADIESGAYRVGVCCCIPHNACRADAGLHRRHLGQLQMGMQTDGSGGHVLCGC